MNNLMIRIEIPKGEEKNTWWADWSTEKNLKMLWSA